MLMFSIIGQKCFSLPQELSLCCALMFCPLSEKQQHNGTKVCITGFVLNSLTGKEAADLTAEKSA